MQANEIRKVKGMTYAKEKIQITQAKYRSVKITIKFRSFLQGTKGYEALIYNQCLIAFSSLLKVGKLVRNAK